MLKSFSPIKYFNPRSPCGERQAPEGRYGRTAEFQSALPLRGATRKPAHLQMVGVPISIRAPLAGSDLAVHVAHADDIVFQSALPLRGATRGVPGAGRPGQDFNPRSPCGERPAPCPKVEADPVISIRAPLAGSDIRCKKILAMSNDFNPRSPCGERLDEHKYTLRDVVISIRAPLAGSDAVLQSPNQGEWNFNPRSPCGERPQWGYTDAAAGAAFQSALPLRGATYFKVGNSAVYYEFQSALPLRGATDLATGIMQAVAFQSALPLRGATNSDGYSSDIILISIRAPLAGSDLHRQLHHL